MMYNMDIDIATARKTLSQVVANLGESGPVRITRYGRVVAVLAPPSDLHVTLDDMEGEAISPGRFTPPDEEEKPRTWAQRNARQAAKDALLKRIK